MVNGHMIVAAHGILAVLAWVVFFPLGAVLVRVLNGTGTWKVHASIQLFAAAVFTTAVGLGAYIAKKTHQLDENHVIIGLTVFALMVLQAVGGTIHHVLFKKKQRRTIVTHVHLWVGRALITLAMINGGLGLMLSGDSDRNENIAYGVIAGLIWSGWLVTSAVFEAKKKRTDSVSSKEKKLNS